MDQSGRMRKYIIYPAAILLLAMALLLPASGATYYVADWGSPANPGTIDHPWDSIASADASAVLVGGDVVIVKPGSYGVQTLSVTSGSSGNPITYKVDGSSGGSAIIQASLYDACIQVSVSDVVLEGFEVTGGYVGIQTIGADRVTVKNCWIHSIAELYGTVPTMVDLTSDTDGTTDPSDGCIIENNILGDLSDTATVGCRGVAIDGSTGTKIYNNTMVKGGYALALLSGTGTEFKNNIAYAMSGAAIYAQSGLTIAHSNNVYFQTAGFCIPASIPADATDLNVDPQFVGGTSTPCALMPGSPAIDAGIDLGRFTYYGTAPDAGAVESNYPAGTPSCSISGTVTNSVSGLPMAGAVVELCQGASVLRTTATNSAGSYQLCLDVPASFPETYTVKAYAMRSSGQADVTFNEAADLTQDVVIDWQPAIFHVKTDGNDGNDGLTEATAWKKFSNANGKLLAGDTLLVHAGTYNHDNQGDASNVVINLVDIDGSVDYPVTIEAAGDGPVVIQGNESTVPYAMSLHSNINGLTIDGLNFEHFGVGIELFYGGAENVTIRNCVFSNTHVNTGQGIYVFGSAAATVPIEGITIEKCAFYGIQYDTWFNCIRAEGGTSGMKVRNCTFDNAFSGIVWIPGGPDIFPGNAETDVRNNIFANMSYAPIENHGGLSGVREYNMYYNTTQASLNTGEFFASPSFMSDFTLGPCSEAIDAGVDVGLPYLGLAPDLGAYETDPATMIPSPISIEGTVTYSNGGEPLVGVTVQLLQGTTVIGSALTDSAGYYFLCAPEPASYPVTFTVLATSGLGSAQAGVTFDAEGTITQDIVITHDPVTYHVSTLGSDSNDGLTEATAWKKISNANGKLFAGDTVLVHAGTYNHDNQGDASDAVVVIANINGMAGAPITIKAAGDGPVVIQGNESTVPNTFAFHQDVNYVTIDGFNFEHFGRGLFLIGGPEYITIRNCTFSNTSAVEAGIGIHLLGYNAATAPQDGITVENCLWHDCHAGWWFACIRFDEGGTNGMKVRNCTFDGAATGIVWIPVTGGYTNADVRNNIFSNMSYQAMEFFGQPIGTVEYNLYYNTPMERALATGDIQANPFFMSDYTLGPCSPAIDAGVDIGLPYNGLAPDLGAYETDPATMTPATEIHGIVFNTATAIPIEGATIESLTSGVSTISGADGSYSLCLQSGSQNILCSYAGQTESWATTLTEGTDTEHDFNFNVAPTTYYVKPGGNDALNGKSLANAWATIDNGDIKRILGAGAMIEIQAGDYPSIVIANSCGNSIYPIVYHANGTVRITCDGVVRALWVKDLANYHTFDGFEITGAIPGAFVPVRFESVTAPVMKNSYIHCTSGGLHGEVSVYACTNGIFHNNVTQGVAAGGGQTSDWMWDVTACVNTKLYNNYWDNGFLALIDQSSGTQFKNNIVTHMIFDGGPVGAWGADFTAANNCFFGNYLEPGLSPGEFIGDPGIVASGSYPGYYNLQVSSPCIDAGIDVGLPVNGLPDVGAFESAYGPYGTLCDTASDAKALADGTAVRLGYKAVVAEADSYTDKATYVEEPDRSSGIKMLGNGVTLPSALGIDLKVSGTKTTDVNGEPYIAVTAFNLQTGTELTPLGMTNKTFGSTYGPDSTGLLVKVWGLVTVVTPDYIYIDDGSGFDDGSGNGTGIRIKVSGVTSPITLTFTAGETYVKGVYGPAALDTGGVPCLRAVDDSCFTL